MRDYYRCTPPSQNAGALFPQNITRRTYLLRGLLFFCAAFVVSCLIDVSAHHSVVAKLILLGGAVALLLSLGIALFGAILMPRLRDMGLHPAWSLLFFVPHVGTLFLFALLIIPSNAFVRQPHYT